MDRRKGVADGGFIIVLLAAGLLLVICLIAGMAIDGGRAYALKSEIQNAGDAAALAGASMLYRAGSSTPLAQVVPDWTSAAARARDFVRQNNVAGEKLTDADIINVEAGYWNINQAPPGIQPQSITPRYQCSNSGNSCTPTTVATACSATEACLQQDVPAVRVTVQKQSVPTFFAKLIGWSSFSPGAAAVAGRGYPRSGKVSFPFATTKCMVDYFIANNLYEDPTRNTFSIPGNYLIPNCNTGNWTTFTLGSNANAIVQGLLDGSIPPLTVSVGDNIEIQPGVRANLFADTEAFIGQTVFIPVVADNLVTTNCFTPVTGFMSFKVTAVTGTGPIKSISGQFVAYNEEETATGIGGPQGNTVSLPSLLK